MAPRQTQPAFAIHHISMKYIFISWDSVGLSFCVVHPSSNPARGCLETRAAWRGKRSGWHASLSQAPYAYTLWAA